MSSEATPHAVGRGTEEQQEDSGDRENSAKPVFEAGRKHDGDQQQSERCKHCTQFAATRFRVDGSVAAPHTATFAMSDQETGGNLMIRYYDTDSRW